MLNLEPILLWHHLFKEAQKIEEYDDLNHEFSVLISKVEGNREVDEEINNEFYEILQTQWKRIIRNKSDELEDRIRKRITKGQNFSNNLKDINKIRRKGEKNLEIQEYPELYKDLVEIENDANTKISIERYNIVLFFVGLLLGYLIKKFLI